VNDLKTNKMITQQYGWHLLTLIGTFIIFWEPSKQTHHIMGHAPIALLMFIHASTLFQFALIIFFFCLCRLTSPWIHFNKLIVLISSQSSHTSLYGNWRMCLGFTFYCKIKNWQENWELTRFFMLILYDKFMDASLELFPELKSSIRLN
jgi:hypothetical protein